MWAQLQQLLLMPPSSSRGQSAHAASSSRLKLLLLKTRVMQVHLLPSGPAQAQRLRRAQASVHARPQLHSAHLLQQQRGQIQQQVLLVLKGFQGQVLTTALLRQPRGKEAASCVSSATKPQGAGHCWAHGLRGRQHQQQRQVQQRQKRPQHRHRHRLMLQW
jgi:hypothetical protein